MTYSQHVEDVRRLLQQKGHEWRAIKPDFVARMRLQIRFRTGLDIARYTALFLSDSRDHLQRCNELLLAFERDPGSSARPTTRIFRLGA